MLNIAELEEKLKTRTIEQVASGLDITVDSLMHHLKSQGISTRDIKRNYAIEQVTKLLKTSERRGISAITGFTLRKVDKYIKLIRDTRKSTL